MLVTQSFGDRCATLEELLSNSFAKWTIDTSPLEKTMYREMCIYLTKHKMIKIVTRLRNQTNEDYCYEYIEYEKTTSIHNLWKLIFMTSTDYNMRWYEYRPLNL